MTMINKNLTEHLKTKNQDIITLSFAEIEGITGKELSQNARTNSAFWANAKSDKSYSVYWMNAGYEVNSGVDAIRTQVVTFNKRKENSNRITTPNMANTENFVYNNVPTYNPPAPQSKTNKEKLILSDLTLNEFRYKVMSDTSYGAESDLISSILKRFPNNTDPEIVALKVSLIDLTNTTQLSRAKNKLSLKDIVDKIVNTKDFDERVKQGDRTLVSEIAKSCKTEFGYNPFSFMSKYCTYHNTEVYRKDDYSIFDNVLKNNLPKYIENINANEIDRWRDKCDYESYWLCIDGLLKYINCNIENKRRSLDYCIWYYYRPEKEE